MRKQADVLEHQTFKRNANFNCNDFADILSVIMLNILIVIIVIIEILMRI